MMKTFLLLIGTSALVVALWFTSTIYGRAASQEVPVPALRTSQGKPSPPMDPEHQERPLAILTPVTHSKTSPTSQATAKPVKGKANGKEDCDTGCAATDPSAMSWTATHFRHHLGHFAKEPLEPGAKSLETLLFYGLKTESLLAKEKTPPLPAGHLSFLKRELRRTHIMLGFRIKDNKGTIRASFQKQARLGEHFHFEAQHIQGIQRPSFGGNSKRVGLHHIWVRI